MKKILRTLVLVSIIVGATTMSAQEKSNPNIHPDIQKYTESLKLTPEQTKKMTSVYEDRAAAFAELDREMKKVQMTQKKKSKSATPAEREKILAMSDVIAQRMQIMEADREENFVKILDEEQLKIYNADIKANASEKIKSPAKLDEKVKKTYTK